MIPPHNVPLYDQYRTLKQSIYNIEGRRVSLESQFVRVWYAIDGNKHQFRPCEGQGGLETKLMVVLIANVEVAYLGQSRRIDFVKNSECGFEGGSPVLQ